MAPSSEDVRRGPYEPIDANRPRYGTAEERKQALSETLVWGWSALIVLGAAYGIHEILAQGSLSFGYFSAGLVTALLIGATEYHIVCNVIASASAPPRAMLFVATALCLGFLFVFNHVAVVSVLGTPRLAYDAWFRDAAATNTSISTRLQSVEFSLEQLIGAQYEPRGEEEDTGAPPAENGTNAFSAALVRWNDAFTGQSAPLKAAVAAFPRDPALGQAASAQSQAAGVSRALAGFNAQIRLETTATGFDRYLNTAGLVEDAAAQRHLRNIASELDSIAGIEIAQLPSDRSAGINALKRLGGAIAGLFGMGAGGSKPLTARDFIGLGTSALALLFVLLLQANRWRFRMPDLPEPPDSLNAHEHTK